MAAVTACSRCPYYYALLICTKQYLLLHKNTSQQRTQEQQGRLDAAETILLMVHSLLSRSSGLVGWIIMGKYSQPYTKIIQLSANVLIMKRNQTRAREFSATRLSYSRNTTDKISNHNPSPSRVTRPPQPDKDRALTLICNNCFNQQASKHKNNKHLHSTDANVNEHEWGLLKNGASQKKVQKYQNQVKKMKDYNLHQIQQHQRARQLTKNQRNNSSKDENYFGDKQQQESRIKETKRIQLKRELQSQIAAAKQRRERQKKQQRDASPNFIINSDATKQKRAIVEEQYKMSLLQQMNYNKNKKVREVQQDSIGYQLPFLKQHQQKWDLYTKARNTIKQNVREELKKKKESQENLRANYNKAREQQEKSRLQNERIVRQQKMKVEQIRKSMINGYIQDLKKQMQENQVRRQKEFQKVIQNHTVSIIPTQNERSYAVKEKQACGCCAKEFPKTYLSPLLRQNPHLHD